MELNNRFFKRAASLLLCLTTAGMMLFSFTAHAESPDEMTLGDQFYGTGEVIYDNTSIAGVYSGPAEDVVFEIEDTTTITGIWTYHWYRESIDEWEDAYVWIESEDGYVYGPWDVQAEEGQGGRENVNWYVFPYVTLEPGTYYLYDSNLSTWSYAYDTDNKGICMIRGISGGTETNNTSLSFLDGENLLTNPSFEKGLKGWEDPDELWGTDPDTTDHEATDGECFAWPSEGASEDTYIYQDVDIDSDDIGKTAILSAMIANFDQTPIDLARLELIFLDSKGKEIESYYQEHQDIEWGRHTITATIPNKTATIRVQLHAIRYAGSIIDAYFDDIFLGVTDEEFNEAGSYAFSYYTISVPDYWGEAEYDDDGTIYFFGEDEYDLPAIMFTYTTIEDALGYEIDLMGLTDEEAIECLEEFKESILADDVDASNITDSEEITIAGYPAIIYSATISILGRNDVRIAHFMDGEYFYDLMIIEYEDSDPSYLTDLDYIVASFSR